MTARPDKAPRRSEETQSPASPEREAELLASLRQDLLDYAAPICITDRRGALVYNTAAYQRLADDVSPAERAPLRRDGEESSVISSARSEVCRQRRKRIQLSLRFFFCSAILPL